MDLVIANARERELIEQLSWYVERTMLLAGRLSEITYMLSQARQSSTTYREERDRIELELSGLRSQHDIFRVAVVDLVNGFKDRLAPDNLAHDLLKGLQQALIEASRESS